MSSKVNEEIERIRQYIANDARTYTRGRGAERNTLEHLVRPLIFSLGWPPRQIRSEHPVELENGTESFADYVLFHETSPVLVVEGKKLGADISPGSDSIHQLSRYLIGLDCQFGVTTNGRAWNLWKRNGYQMSSVWSIDIVEMDLPALTKSLDDIRYDRIQDLGNNVELREVRRATLESAWHDILHDRQLQIKRLATALKEQVDTIDEGLGIKDVYAEEYLNELYQDTPELLAAPVIETCHPTPDSTEARQMERKPPPSKLVIQDDVLPISDVYEILTKTAEWLIEKDYLSRDDCPVQVASGSRAFRYLVNTSPVHSNGQEFTAPREIDQGMYVETHYNREQAEYYAAKLLNEFIPSGELRTED